MRVAQMRQRTKMLQTSIEPEKKVSPRLQKYGTHNYYEE